MTPEERRAEAKTRAEQRRAEERAAMHSELYDLNVKYLKKAGWRDVGGSKWIPKGIRKTRGTNSYQRTSWSFLAAVQTQMEMEMQQSAAEVFTDRKVSVKIA